MVRCRIPRPAPFAGATRVATISRRMLPIVRTAMFASPDSIIIASGCPFALAWGIIRYVYHSLLFVFAILSHAFAYCLLLIRSAVYAIQSLLAGLFALYDLLGKFSGAYLVLNRPVG
jgi:hypothetical protein